MLQLHVAHYTLYVTMENIAHSKYILQYMPKAALCHNVCAMWCPHLCDVHYLPLSVCVVPSEAVYSAVLSSFVCSGEVIVLCGLMLYCIAGW